MVYTQNHVRNVNIGHKGVTFIEFYCLETSLRPEKLWHLIEDITFYFTTSIQIIIDHIEIKKHPLFIKIIIHHIPQHQHTLQ